MAALTDLPPVPVHDVPVTAHGYGEVPIDSADPRGREPLVDLGKLGLAGANYYAMADGGNAPYGERLAGSISVLLAREGVAKRLLEVNRFLAPFGAELFLWDAYRPIATQAGIWDFFAKAYQAETPDIEQDTLQTRLRHYISDPRAFHEKDPASWPTHSTGAALDLTLCERSTGTLLPMGAAFDQMDEAAHTDFYERAAKAGEIAPSDPRLLNRRLLYHAMGSQGFVNYPKEFWHFDSSEALRRPAGARMVRLYAAPREYRAQQRLIRPRRIRQRGERPFDQNEQHNAPQARGSHRCR